MPTTLESCEEFFGSKNLYEIFGIDKKATVAEIKKAYYKHALKVHPDRVPEAEKVEATEKFKILAKVHEVLSDEARRALYDEQGIIDDDDDEKFGSSWLEAFKNLFKPITDSDIDNYRKGYIGSDMEKYDLKRAYNNGGGCINYIMEHVPFMGVEDEPRFHTIINEWIANKEVEEFKAFTNEAKAKRARRHKKYARESEEADKLKEKMQQEQSVDNDLAKQIMKRNQERGSSFLDKLMEKYANDDDEDEVDIRDLGRRTQNKRKSAAGKEKTPIRSGRVSKRNK